MNIISHSQYYVNKINAKSRKIHNENKNKCRTVISNWNTGKKKLKLEREPN